MKRHQINISGDLGNFSFKEDYLIKKIVKTTFNYLGITSYHIVNFYLCDSKTIHEYNLAYRHIDRPTDVISFAYYDLDKNKPYPTELGDIIICIDKVKEQASEYKHSERRELAFLTVHGMLHILGYDHQTKSDEEKMFKLQEDILDFLKIKRK